MKPPNGIAEIRQVLGDAREAFEPYTGDFSSALELAWRKQILAKCTLPKPATTGSGGTIYSIWCHRAIVEPLTEVLEHLASAGLWHLIRSFNGCYAFRAKRGLDKLSVHTWGAAIDWNAKWNRLGTRGDQDPRFIEAWESHGWRWGGRWRRSDPMHVQYVTGY